MNKIGITTTIPSEVLLASNHQPLDLNNLYIGADNPDALVKRAEKDGFPVNCCAWIKGIYGAVLEHDIKKVICVSQGDCSNTEMLMEVLRMRNIEALPFQYPSAPDKKVMRDSLENLANYLDTTLSKAEKERKKLHAIRQDLFELDRLTYETSQVSGWENHSWLVSSSDYNGDAHLFEQKLKSFLREVRVRQAKKYTKRLAIIGVPSIYAKELYTYIESIGAHVVLNETQHQFAMLNEASNLTEQYSLYTYPYSTYYKIDDIKKQLKLRKVDGIIHYVQAFCHRGISDIIYRQELPAPILTIEGNAETTISQHLATRIEAFLDILR